MQLLFFGSLQEALKMSHVELAIDVTNLNELKNYLEERYVFLQEQPYTFAVNEVLTRNLDQEIKPEDVIALLPPFSGG
ncbi:MAG TPA: MoaD/ThiS family protein [Saprospiraceae bacterium]|nr:MoaD/ThiS family protein [Saprospiraceae bacterium]